MITEFMRICSISLVFLRTVLFSSLNGKIGYLISSRANSVILTWSCLSLCENAIEISNNWSNSTLLEMTLLYTQAS